MVSRAEPFRNQLLAALSAEDLERIAPYLQPVALEPLQVLERFLQPVEYVYFPESGIASVIAIDGKNRRMEVGPFGRDGMSGLTAVLEADRSAHETLVQVPGHAHRIEVGQFRTLLETSPTLRRLMLRYVLAFTIQTAHTALAAGLAVVEKRLARWILMLHDRIDGEELMLTHEFMALMLAVRRPGVTVALHELEGRYFIRSMRGRVVVRDRKGLESFCEGLYGVPEAEYARLINGG